MIRKKLNALNGIKVKTSFSETKNNSYKQHRTIDSDEKVNICLNCTKPASQCKGDCFGRSN